jgi:glutamate--cysteine ligase
LSETAAEEHIHGICFKTGPPGRVGVELEWLVRAHGDAAAPADHERVTRALAELTAAGELPGGGRLTIEPGGQVEISSAPAAGIGSCVTQAGRDLAAVREALGEAGLTLAGLGVDPYRLPARVLDLPRYAAMEQFFDRGGPWGRVMMCSTASVQVCVDAGCDDDGYSGFRWRWRLLHALGPVLVAAFANSPLRAGRLTGWKSTRQAVWAQLDPGRTRAPAGAEPWSGGHGPATNGSRIGALRNHGVITLPGRSARPVGDGAVRAGPWGAVGPGWPPSPRGPGRGGADGKPNGTGPTGRGPNGTGRDSTALGRVPRRSAASDDAPDPRAGWAQYALDAQVMCVRRGESQDWSAPPGLTFRDWLRGRGCEERPPTQADLAYHLSTLFPPVRPQGHLEVRFIDAQPGDGWIVPAAVVSALADDPVAAQLAMAAAEPVWWYGDGLGLNGAGLNGAGPKGAGPNGAGPNGAGLNGSWGPDGSGPPGPWLRAARLGLADPALARAARACFEAADAALGRAGAPAGVRRRVADFAEEYVLRGRCPADDTLEGRGPADDTLEESR